MSTNLISPLIGSPFQDGFLLGVTATASVCATVAMVVLVTGTAPRMMGGDAERWTAEELRDIQGHGYEVIHHAGLAGGDIDHVLIGPGGTFVLETKWSSQAWDLEQPDALLSKALDQVRRNAHRMLLTARRFGVEKVTPVLVVWGPAGQAFEKYGVPVRRLADGTLVLPGHQLRRWSLGLGRDALSSDQIALLHGDLARLAIQRDELEIPNPPSLSELGRAAGLQLGIVLAALLVPGYMAAAGSAALGGTVALLIGIGAWLRWRLGWRLTGMAVITVQLVLLLAIFVDAVA